MKRSMRKANQSVRISKKIKIVIQLTQPGEKETEALVDEHLSMISSRTLEKFVFSCWREGDKIATQESEIEQLLEAMKVDPDADEEQADDDDPIVQIVVSEENEAEARYVRNRDADWNAEALRQFYAEEDGVDSDELE